MITRDQIDQYLATAREYEEGLQKLKQLKSFIGDLEHNYNIARQPFERLVNDKKSVAVLDIDDDNAIVVRYAGGDRYNTIDIMRKEKCEPSS